MSFDTFSTALQYLLPHTASPKPQLYAHLAGLLNQYSTGLSLPITLDSLSKLSPPAKEHSFIDATVTATHPHPKIHVLKSRNRYIAFFPPSTCPHLPPSTALRLPLTAVSVEALSLARRSISEYSIKHAILPTQAVAIRLPFKHQLPLPESSYNLFSIWHNRDLTPPAVYATLIEKHPQYSSLILVDQCPDSPSVEFKLSPARQPLLSILPLPCIILVTQPAVTPTDNSFILHDTPSSTFFYKPLPLVESNKKRRRSSSTDTLYKAADLHDLTRCDDLQPITVHTRVEKVDYDGGIRLWTCDNVCINIPPGDYQRGDEILLKRVIYNKQWIAKDVTNISTMQGVLHCPFVRKLVSVDQAMQLCQKQEFTTAQIKVSVTAVVKQAEFVELSVVDSKHDQRGFVCMKTRGYEQLFVVSRECFLQLDKDVVEENVNRISPAIWMMTVTCGVADHPVLTACLRGG